MTPHYVDNAVTLYHADALDLLRSLPDASIDAVVTDPPYGLADHVPAVVTQALQAWLSGDREYVPGGKGFMGREWDRFVPPPAVWDECLRVLKPGAHLLAFAGSRTQDLTAMAIRLAGFEIRDGIDWLYAQGFPKSLDVSKAIDKAAGAEREVLGPATYPDGTPVRSAAPSSKHAGWRRPWMDEVGDTNGRRVQTSPATDDASRWAGWGTALKPAREPIVVARKPLVGTVAQNVLAYGTGALNIDATRVGTNDDLVRSRRLMKPGAQIVREGGAQTWGESDGPSMTSGSNTGRWPTNVVLSHAATPDGVDLCGDGCVNGCPVADLDRQSGTLTSGANPCRRGSDKFRYAYGDFKGHAECVPARGADSGGASRFFPVFRYEAKASIGERPRDGATAHPTVKPLGLMRWLVRLITPPGGTVLDFCAGSGTTGEACVIEGFQCVLVEREAPYLPLITARLTRPLQPALDIFGGAA